MKLVVDIEANGLYEPTEIWVICCKDPDTGEKYVFRHPTATERGWPNEEKRRFLELASKVDYWIGHNWLEYDYPVLNSLLGLVVDRVAARSCDTLLLSRLVDYSRSAGHSIEAYGKQFGLEKGDNTAKDFWKGWSQELEDYCVRDVDICHRIYDLYASILGDPAWAPAILLENEFQGLINDLQHNGFAFDRKRAAGLLDSVTAGLATVDKEILDAFPPKLVLERQINPRLTKHGTLNRSDFRWVKDGDLSEFNGGPFCKCRWEEFNPASHKQLIEVLNRAEWRPTDKTTTHIHVEREINRLKYRPKDLVDTTVQELYTKLNHLKVYGWKINEDNLATLPSSAPAPARLLARRILLESRRRTLTEWLGLVKDDDRIHGKFLGIGAWTHRMAHQNPNTANIPLDRNVHDGSVKYLGKELRSLWRAPKNRLIVGVDAESIQLRVFAHYINDPDFTRAIVEGKKADKSDPHSFNQKIFGPCCKTRQASKHSLYAIFFGGGPGKIGEIMGCSKDEAAEAMDNLARRYQGLSRMKDELFPIDARRGYFIGLDGRKVAIPGDTVGQRRHLCMSGYLQNGEAIIMKKAALLWYRLLSEEKDIGKWLFVNMVHDEWQTEVKNDMEVAIRIAKIQADSLRIVGEELKLNCPMAGSYWNDDHNDFTIGTNWYQTH